MAVLDKLPPIQANQIPETDAWRLHYYPLLRAYIRTANNSDPIALAWILCYRDAAAWLLQVRELSTTGGEIPSPPEEYYGLLTMIAYVTPTAVTTTKNKR